MTVAERIYKLLNKKKLSGGGQIPYYYKYSLGTIISKPIRKWFSAVLIPTIPFNNVRIWLYRCCGYKIGKGCFIGMRCYLDDMCFDKLRIGDNVTISYGVYFACHGRGQGHNGIVIEDGAYIGMRATILAREDIVIGRNSVIGACTLVNKSIPEGLTAVGVPCRLLVEKLPKGDEKVK